MLDPDSDAAKAVMEHCSALQKRAADAEMRAVLNRAEIVRLSTALEYITEHHTDMQACLTEARKALEK